MEGLALDQIELCGTKVSADGVARLKAAVLKTTQKPCVVLWDERK